MKSLIGIGIFFVMYSQMTSMLYLSWAEIGMIGAPSATVPKKLRYNLHIKIESCTVVVKVLILKAK